MNPKWYYLYKIFEPSLQKADTNTPCKDFKYSTYKETETHGALGITMTLDLYLPDKRINESEDEEMLKFLELAGKVAEQ